MLSKILEKPGLSPGAIRIAAWLYGCNGGRSVRRTVEKLAADAGCDKRAVLDNVRSGQTKPGAISQLADVGVPIHVKNGEVVFVGNPVAGEAVQTAAHSTVSVTDFTVQESVSIVGAPISDAERERRKLRKAGIFADCVQLSFDDMDAAPVTITRKPVSVSATAEKRPTMQTAALRVAHSADCATNAQPLRNECTTNAQPALSDVQKALFDRIQSHLDAKKSIPEPEPPRKSPAPPIPINQELINPINPIIPLPTPTKPIQETLVIPIPAPAAAKTEVWNQARYSNYVDEIKERFPGWSKKIFNPQTKRWGDCAWAVNRLAAIMGWGAPVEVAEQVLEFATSSNPNVRARNPAAGFLYKVTEMSKKWRWKK